MAKMKTLEKLTISLKNGKPLADNQITFREYNPTEYLLNKENIAGALLECLRENDFEGFVEVVLAYLEALETTRAPKKQIRKKVSPASEPKNPAVELAALFHETRHTVTKK